MTDLSIFASPKYKPTMLGGKEFVLALLSILSQTWLISTISLIILPVHFKTLLIFVCCSERVGGGGDQEVGEGSGEHGPNQLQVERLVTKCNAW